MDDELDLFGWVGGTVDGKYRVDAVVGRGGFGVVYRAHHLGFDQTVALKCLRLPKALSGADRDRFQDTFLAEGRLLHQLSRATAGIVQALDLGAAVSPNKHWTPYLVLEWLEGRPLDREFADRRSIGVGGRSIPDALRLLSSAVRALGIAHDQGVAHRDIKPANLFLANIGGQTVLKVLDFGIAKVMAQSESVTRAFEETGASLQAFTARYGAPEQFSRRYGATGPWTDVFALALVFVETVLGRPALEGSDAAQLFVASSDPERRPTLRNAGMQVPDGIEFALTRALAIDPRERFAHVREFWQALESAALEAGLTSQPPPSPRPRLASAASGFMPIGADEETSPEPSVGPATELSSSQHVSSAGRATGKPRAPASWWRNAVLLLLISSACGALLLLIPGAVQRFSKGAGSSSGLRRAMQPGDPTSQSPSVNASRPDALSDPSLGSGTLALQSARADGAIAPPLSTRAPPFGGIPQRDVPAGSVAEAYIGNFRVLARAASFGLDFAGANRLCADVGMSLCTEPQWAHACATFPELRSVPSWTQGMRDDAIIVRGGGSCATTHTASPAERVSDRFTLCCDRAIAMDTNNLQKQYLLTTAERILAIEKALNQRNLPALLLQAEPSVAVDGESKTQAELETLLELDFAAAPDLLVTNASCDVAVQAKKVTKRSGRRKKVVYETQGWTAACEQIAWLAGKASARTVTYSFSATSKLREIATTPATDD